MRSIDCIACTPFFKRELLKVRGVEAVNPIVMLNKIEVEIDSEVVTAEQIKERILAIAQKAGYGGRVVFLRS